MGADFYHCRLKAMGRNAGKSAVACAAYRAGMALQDERYGLLRDFSRKSDVVTTFTLAPDGAPDWACDVAQLWNHVEAHERRKDAQLAYEWEVALPNELDDATREDIARDFAGWLVEQYGVAVTVGIHSGGNRGNGLNDHMHVMMTRRGVSADGFELKILPQFSVNPRVDNPEVGRVREYVADIINEALEDAGSDTRVDHRSFRERGIDREPTRHLGPAATAYERQGYETDRGDINRDIIEDRLRWQMEQAQPEITAKLEAEFTSRFGDDPRPGLVAEPLGAREDLQPATRDADHDDLTPLPATAAPAGEPRRASPWGRAWRAFSDRAREMAASLHELWGDQSSGSKGREAGEPKHEGMLWQARVLAERAAEKMRELFANQRGSVPAGDEPAAPTPPEDLMGRLFTDAGDDGPQTPPGPDIEPPDYDGQWENTGPDSEPDGPDID